MWKKAVNPLLAIFLVWPLWTKVSGNGVEPEWSVIEVFKTQAQCEERNEYIFRLMERKGYKKLSPSIFQKPDGLVFFSECKPDSVDPRSVN